MTSNSVRTELSVGVEQNGRRAGGTMLPWVPLVLAIVFSVAGASAQETRPAKPAGPDAARAPVRADVRGVWKVTELASRAPGAEWEIRTTPYLSQYIFTGKHYSYMYVPGPGPRKRIAASELSGQILTLLALVHKNPNEMDGKPLTYTVELDGNTRRMTIANPPFLPGREWRTVLTRVE